jgi:hypothetical protein
VQRRDHQLAVCQSGAWGRRAPSSSLARPLEVICRCQGGGQRGSPTIDILPYRPNISGEASGVGRAPREWRRSSSWRPACSAQIAWRPKSQAGPSGQRSEIETQDGRLRCPQVAPVGSHSRNQRRPRWIPSSAAQMTSQQRRSLWRGELQPRSRPPRHPPDSGALGQSAASDAIAIACRNNDPPMMNLRSRCSPILARTWAPESWEGLYGGRGRPSIPAVEFLCYHPDSWAASAVRPRLPICVTWC